MKGTLGLEIILKPQKKTTILLKNTNIEISAKECGELRDLVKGLQEFFDKLQNVES